MRQWRPFSLVFATAGLFLMGCEKNPVDTAFDYLLDFDGIFEALDGTKVEIDGSGGLVSEVGSETLLMPIRLGDRYFHGMYNVGPGEWRGQGKMRSGFLDHVNVRMTENGMTVEAGETLGGEKVAHAYWTRIGDRPERPNPPTSHSAPPNFTSTEQCRAYWHPILTSAKQWRLVEAVTYWGEDYLKTGVIESKVIRYDQERYSYELVTPVSQGGYGGRSIGSGTYQILYQEGVPTPCRVFSTVWTGSARHIGLESYQDGIINAPRAYGSIMEVFRWAPDY